MGLAQACGRSVGEGRRVRPDKNRLIGIGLVLCAFAILPVLDGIAKALGATFHPLQVTFGRYAFSMAVLLPIAAYRFGWRMFMPPSFCLQAVRGACLVAATMLFFTALVYLSMAQTMALGFVYPLIVTLAAPWVLGERLNGRKLLAAMVGLLGALLIIRPGGAAFHPAMLLALATAFVFAGYVMLTRKLASRAPHLQSLFFTSVIGTAVMTPIAPLVWAEPGWLDWAGFALIGAIASLGHLLLMQGYGRAPASVLAPLGYFEMISTVAVGFAMFGDLPDGWTWAGILVIAGSGVFVTLQGERAVRLAPASPG